MSLRTALTQSNCFRTVLSRVVVCLCGLHQLRRSVVCALICCVSNYVFANCRANSVADNQTQPCVLGTFVSLCGPQDKLRQAIQLCATWAVFVFSQQLGVL